MSSTADIDGYDDSENPSFIHLNIWKIHRSPASICNTIIHSCVHAVNAMHPEHFFGHGERALTNEQNSAPYAIGALAQRVVSKGLSSYIALEHDPYESGIQMVQRQSLIDPDCMGTGLAHANCFFPIVN
jgi:hypothetical protein